MEKFVNNIKLKLLKILLPFRLGSPKARQVGKELRVGLFGIGLSLLFVLGFILARIDTSKLETIKRSQIILGTVVEIQARDEDPEKADGAISKAFSEMKRIDALFSSYNKKSPVWKLNHTKVTPQDLPEELFGLMVFSDSIWKISDGAFDVSLGNLIKLWGFASDNHVVPNKDKINDALNYSGWRNIRINKAKPINYTNDVKFDFGAVAKGYAVDKAIELIKLNGITVALVNAGGEVKGFGNDWIVGIQHPRNRHGIIGKIKLNGNSVATSGDYEQYFEKDGKRYHHIFDPKTGMPANECQSVTIISKENKTADALATAVFVLGVEKGMRLVENLSDVEAMIVDSNGQTVLSKGFNKFLLR